MTLEEIHTLFQYDEWATKRTIESVTSLYEEQYKRDLESAMEAFTELSCTFMGQTTCGWSGGEAILHRPQLTQTKYKASVC
jgi:uncharacterized damage-inducible protein DinB